MGLVFFDVGFVVLCLVWVVLVLGFWMLVVVSFLFGLVKASATGNKPPCYSGKNSRNTQRLLVAKTTSYYGGPASNVIESCGNWYSLCGNPEALHLDFIATLEKQH